MSEKLSKLVQWFLYLLLGLTTILGVIFFFDPEANIDLLIYWGYFLLILVTATTLIVSLIGILKNPKASIKLLIVLAGMAIVFFISYSLSKNTFSSSFLEKQEVTVTTVRIVGAGLYVLYLFGLGAILAIIYSTISRVFK